MCVGIRQASLLYSPQKEQDTKMRACHIQIVCMEPSGELKFISPFLLPPNKIEPTEDFKVGVSRNFPSD